jgi:hypothetical protein
LIRKHSSELIKNLQNFKISKIVSPTPKNVSLKLGNVSLKSQNVSLNSENVSLITNSDSNNGVIECISKYECCFCHKMYSHRQSLYKHNKVCNAGLTDANNSNKHKQIKQTTDTSNDSTLLEKHSILPIQNSASQIGHNIQNAQMIQNAQHISNTTINILTFPDSIDNENFEFNTSHITKKQLQRIARNVRPEISFAKFAVLTMEQPENRLVKKSSPNVRYSMIHVGNGIWELAIDDYIYPTIIHFLTCGALKIIEENPELKDLIEPFRIFVDHINTDNESDVYKDTEYHVKLLIINITRQNK